MRHGRKILVGLSALVMAISFGVTAHAKGKKTVGILYCPVAKKHYEEFRADYKKKYGDDVEFKVYEAHTPDQLNDYAAKLAKEAPDVIVTTCERTTRPVVERIKGTDQKLVFMSNAPSRLVSEWQSSVKNSTGVSSVMEDQVDYNLAQARALHPDAKKIAILTSMDADLFISENHGEHDAHHRHLMGQFFTYMNKSHKAMMAKHGFSGDIINVTNDKELKQAQAKIKKGKYDIVYVSITGTYQVKFDALMDTIKTAKILSVTNKPEIVKSGAVIGFYAKDTHLVDQATVMAKDALDGKAAKDPILATDYEIHVNLTTAQAIGFEVPEDILSKATMVHGKMKVSKK
ncbi:MAG: hypothetical protein H6624_04460 [Bdellovibrionaceae bacterium]|nr:hypothetical protein [Bdellovibrionales bacterium]MCB9083569.1 hypothetical protein [Pseudobdellovibrionaceae bacterium]